MESPDARKFAAVENIEALHGLLASAGISPGWNKPEPSLWPAPRTGFLPAHWSYGLAKAALDAAGRFVPPGLAERRNLILHNPVAGNGYATTRTMVAAYQMVEPGEIAPRHRHTPNALRLVLDAAPGVFTVVDGKQIPMLPGDVVLTPSWSWHGHRNDTLARAYWIDFLDVPLVHFLGPMFFEPSPGGAEDSNDIGQGSPMRFAWADTLRRLWSEPPTSHDEVRLGPPELRSMALYVARLDEGVERSHGRTTENSIFGVIEGSGTADVAGSVFEWARGDVFVVPTWSPFRLHAETRSYLLRVSDEPVLAGLGWHRQG